jgi:phosphatidylinositol alpha-1,6-mannosyltransferase
MQLLILSTEFPPGPGGIGENAYAVAKGLGTRGWRVRVITPQDYATDEEIARFNAAQAAQHRLTIQCANGRVTALGKALHRWSIVRCALRESPPDLIMATGERAAWIAALLPRRCPLVIIGHGSEFGLDTFWERPLTRWAFRRADHVVCVSEYTRRFMLERGFRPRGVSVIPNGADEARFGPLSADAVHTFREKHNLIGANILLTVGNVTERKGQGIVIRALPQILARFPNTRYIAAGLPTQSPAFTALAAQLGVADHVHFWGRVDNETLPLLMNACDIFIMTSTRTRAGDVEGYGIALVEAALCGKPGIASDRSGLAEVIADGQTGILVRQNDPAGTADAVIALLADAPRREQMGAQARTRALAEQTWSARLERYNALFNELINQYNARRKGR